MACLGDLATDIVVRADTGIAAGTDVPGMIGFRAGGSAANTARAFAALGGKAVFVGAIGGDWLGDRLTASLRAAGVTVHAAKVTGASARVLALIGERGERSFVTDRGVADALAPRMLKKRWLAGVGALHVPAYSLLQPPIADAAVAAADEARARGALVSVDLASRRPLLARGRRNAREVLSRVRPDVLFGNEAEVAALVGARDAQRLLDIAPIVVVKQGADGCRLLWRAAQGGAVSQSTVATKPIAATDTTGAGDAFDAGFLHALIVAGHVPGAPISAAVLRRAALAGHRAAAGLLGRPRTELVV